MSAQITCDPLLGQATVVSGEAITFTVVLLPFETLSKWEVAIWHNNSPSRDWVQLNLKLAEQHVQIIHQESEDTNSAISYAGSLPRCSAGDSEFSFTVKYRITGEEWQWANEHPGIKNGEVIFLRDGMISDSFSQYFQNTDMMLNVAPIEASADREYPAETCLWAISTPVPAAEGEQSTFSKKNLGLPVNTLRWFCLARESRPWLCPKQGHDRFAPGEDAILVSFLRRDGLHVVLLALSLNDVLTVIQSNSNGDLIIVARNERQVSSTAYVLVAVGKSFESANQVVMSYAKSIVARENEGMRGETELAASTVTDENLENWYDSFAYCTWNGLGQNLTAERLYDALDTLLKAGINFSTLIIDDNWQSIDDFGSDNFQHGWIEFEADRKAFPDGLKNTVAMIKQRSPSIRHVAVWHGIMGYWNGVSPDGELAKRYKTKTLKKQDNGFFGGGSLVAIDADDAHRLYDDFYRFLADCGIDSVKTDTQFLLDQFEHAADRSRFILKYQDAWIRASVRHFCAKAISCMSQIPQTLFYSQILPFYPRLMVRNSEDFFPDEPLSHPWHIFCNAHTNVLTQHLNVLPDWDMFQTSHEYSAFHAAARCISGGPIYFTDKPGEHDIDLIKQMTAKTINSTIILRPKVARTTYVYASNKENRLLRIETSTRDTDIPMLGVFNVNEHPVTEIVKLEHFQNIATDKSYLVRAHKSGKIFHSTRLQDSNSQLLTLGVKGYEILTAYPMYIATGLTTTPLSSSSIRSFAVLGLLDKMTGAGAILDIKVEEEGNVLLVRVSLKAIGLFGIYISAFCSIYEIKIYDVDISGRQEYVDVNIRENIVKIDMEAAWESIRAVQECNGITISIKIRT